MQSELSEENIIAELLQVWNDFGVQTPAAVASVAKKPQIAKKANINPPPRPIIAYKKPAEAQTLAIDLAKQALNLSQLKSIVESYDGISIKKGAINLVFNDGNPTAKIMIIGDAPSREEDNIGKAFVGPTGQFIDKMFNSIGLSRDSDLYLTYCVNWRPPGNRPPTRDELAIFKPFILRHIELFAPKILILIGDAAAATILDTNESVSKLRRKTNEVRLEGVDWPIKTYCIFHPTHLMRRPTDKALVWKDLLSIADQNQGLLNQ